jgi:hypothetical protein
MGMSCGGIVIVFSRYLKSRKYFIGETHCGHKSARVPTKGRVLAVFLHFSDERLLFGFYMFFFNADLC